METGGTSDQSEEVITVGDGEDAERVRNIVSKSRTLQKLLAETSSKVL